MSMDKLFDGSDAHLLPSNAELIARLRNGAPSILSGRLCFDAADALEAADKRIAELERRLAVAREAMTKAATLECNGVIRVALAQIGGDGAGS